MESAASQRFQTRTPTTPSLRSFNPKRQCTRACVTPAGIMPDASTMMRDLREEMTKPKYDVANYYRTTGFAQWLARQPRFEHATLAVIGLNALWIWIDTDYNPGSTLLTSPQLFQYMEHLFCVYFCFEWTLRFCAFKRKRDGLRDTWFVFDSVVVLAMVVETWIMTVVVLVAPGQGGGRLSGNILRLARLLRLSRMARTARLLRAVPELLLLIKGMIAAMRSVVFTFGFLAAILYVFSIFLVQWCDQNTCRALFPTVPETMHSLLLNVILMDNLSLLIHPLEEQNPALLVMLYLFILLSSLLLMNMLIGVICEVVSAVAETERGSVELAFVREKMMELMTYGGRLRVMISKKEFVDLLRDQEALGILSEVGVDGESLLNMQDALFDPDVHGIDTVQDEDGKQVTFQEFMDLILDLRGGNSTTVKDMVNLRKYMDSRFARLEERMTNPQEGSSNLMAVVAHEPSARTCVSLSDASKVAASSGSSLPSKVEQTAPFLDMAAKMVSAHEREVAVLRQQNDMLRAKFDNLQDCSQSMPMRAVGDVENPDRADIHTLINDIGVGIPRGFKNLLAGLGEPGDEDVQVELENKNGFGTKVFRCRQQAGGNTSRWWNGVVQAGVSLRSLESGAGTGRASCSSEGDGQSTDLASS